MLCPKCGHANPDGTPFCMECHATLLFKCPVCWHQQTHGGNCDQCGTNFAAYWSLAADREAQEEARVDVDRVESSASTLLQFFFWPYNLIRTALTLILLRLLPRLFPRVFSRN
jgi:8-oxo-dGTP pyrophosphatase MutT (NUDIX family)